MATSRIINNEIKRFIGHYTRPEKPINAKDKIAAVMNVMGTPANAPGISASSSFSRIPAKMSMAREKPRAEQNPKARAVTNE